MGRLLAILIVLVIIAVAAIAVAVVIGTAFTAVMLLDQGGSRGQSLPIVASKGKDRE